MKEHQKSNYFYFPLSTHLWKKDSKMPHSSRLIPSYKKLRREGERRQRVQVRQGTCWWPWLAPWLVWAVGGGRARRSNTGGVRDVPLVLLESGSTQGRAECVMECFHPQGRLLKSLFPFHDWTTLMAPQSFPWRLPVVACQKFCNRDIFFSLSPPLCRCLLHENHVLECNYLLAWSSPYSCLSFSRHYAGTFINMSL